MGQSMQEGTKENLWKIAFKKFEGIWSVKFSKGCLPQSLLSPLMNTLPHMIVFGLHVLTILLGSTFYGNPSINQLSNLD